MDNTCEIDTKLLNERKETIIETIQRIRENKINEQIAYNNELINRPKNDFKKRVGDVIIQNKNVEVNIKTEILNNYLNDYETFTKKMPTYDIQYHKFIEKIISTNINIYYDYETGKNRTTDNIFNKFWLSLDCNNDPIKIYEIYFNKYKLFDGNIIDFIGNDENGSIVMESTFLSCLGENITEKKLNNLSIMLVIYALLIMPIVFLSVAFDNGIYIIFVGAQLSIIVPLAILASMANIETYKFYLNNASKIEKYYKIGKNSAKYHIVEYRDQGRNRIIIFPK